MTTYTVVLTGDQHVNSTRGLCAPRVDLDDAGFYEASPDQRWLWRCWQDLIKRVSEIGGDITWVFNGDTLELDAKGRSDQLITRNPDTMVKIAIETLEPAWRVATRCVFVRGTMAHSGKSAAIEETLASDCANAVKNGNAASWWRWIARIGGVTLDIKHHGTLGSQPWTTINPLHTLAYKAERWRHKPDLIVRSHRHIWGDTGDNHDVRVLSLPGWQVETEYSNEKYDDDYQRCGAALVTIQDGEYTIEKIRYERPRFREIWHLP